jgi:hypothetical protein
VMTTMIAISKRSVIRRFIRRTRTYLVNANMPSVFRANGASHIEAEKYRKAKGEEDTEGGQACARGPHGSSRVVSF